MSSSFLWNAGNAADRVAQLQKRLRDDDPRLRHVFTQMFDENLSEHPAGSQNPQAHPANDHPLSGSLISIKDLFDVKGYVTRAGSRFMADNAPAPNDATVVQRLRDAGAILLGHTNMTEIAYSGLGLNPHYGTPDNVLYPGCIPGGSTAGGAISVAAGVADIALGTDTGGSLRIPAAFNGIVGFKPSQASLSRLGCKPLSQSLDSIGPMARDVSSCHLAFQCMRDDPCSAGKPLTAEFVIPDNYGMDDLAPEVAAVFDRAIALLDAAGYRIETRKLASLENLKTLAIWQFAAVEARANYDDAYQAQFQQFDPRVSSRMARAETLSATEYRKTLNLRDSLILQFRREMQGQVLLMPTVPILPPAFEVFDDDDTYARLNMQVLRNPSIANVMDGCSISLPLSHADHSAGIMLTAEAFSDRSLLDLAGRCESVFSGQS